ncbi:MAG: dihydropteroate synthase [Gammaproteobacteria bacterium]|nr:dihydropteroate synthase [Gammaproteobacteria bacterium]
MPEHILFLTGKLAEARLNRVLESMQPADFSYEVRNIGLSVAALMTATMIRRRVTSVNGAARVIVPGLCRGELQEPATALGVPVIRGPDDLKDLPVFFGRGCAAIDLSQTDVLIFAEIVDAPALGVEGVLERARRFAADGADVIDIGCLPDTAFPHLEPAVEALKTQGFRVSIDSLNAEDLLRGARAGADYVLSLTESTLWVADEVAATPVIIPENHGDMESLYRAIDRMRSRGRTFIADSVLDPIHFGLARSLQRYCELRARCADIDVMMGIGNLTELTEADTTGINAVLFGLISELGVTSVLTTEVSEHARSAVREADRARRIMYAARAEGSLPKGLDGGLLTTHERKPFPYTAREVAELAAEIRDPSYRVQVTESGIHVFNRDGMLTGTDAFELFRGLSLLQDDAPHAFYMGVELAKAQVAFQLGKRYVQDEPLNWGVAVAPPAERNEDAAAVHALKGGAYKVAGPTLQASRKRRRKTRRKPG